MSSGIFDLLVEQLQRLPGIGRKTATRLAFSIVDDPGMAKDFTRVLDMVWKKVGECSICRNITEKDVCDVCAGKSRSNSICVVHNPADMRAIEDAGLFRGRYFILHGVLAPLEGKGPEELGIGKLKRMVERFGTEEVILALDTTADGEATSSYLSRVMSGLDVKVTRLARGLPPGASVEFADPLTLTQAFQGRQRV